VGLMLILIRVVVPANQRPEFGSWKRGKARNMPNQFCKDSLD